MTVMSDEQQLATSMVGCTIVAVEWHPERWRSLSVSANVQEEHEWLLLVLSDGRRVEVRPWGCCDTYGLHFEIGEASENGPTGA